MCGLKALRLIQKGQDDMENAVEFMSGQKENPLSSIPSRERSHIPSHPGTFESMIFRTCRLVGYGTSLAGGTSDDFYDRR